MNHNILTTLPHFLSIIPILHLHMTEYISVIVLSTILSILYHMDESNHIIMLYDYGMASVWVLYDIYMGYNTPYLYTIVFINGLSFIINQYTSHISLYHSIWHIINASKCFYVSSLLCLNDTIK